MKIFLSLTASKGPPVMDRVAVVLNAAQFLAILNNRGADVRLLSLHLMRNRTDKHILLSLFLSFLKIGAFTFGGGYAMVSLLENEFVERKKWIDKNEFLDMVAVAESTPGPVAINSATYIGYREAGVAGSAISTFAVALPSFVIIWVISLFFESFLALEWIGWAFKGIEVCVVYLIFTAGLRMLEESDKNALSVVIFISVLVLSVLFSVLSISFSSVFFILLSGMLYLVVSSLGNRKGKEGE